MSKGGFGAVGVASNVLGENTVPLPANEQFGDHFYRSVPTGGGGHAGPPAMNKDWTTP